MKAEAGFSLLEALVALAVFATAAMGLLNLNTNATRISAELGDRVMARQVAENIAVDTLSDPGQQTAGLTQGQETQRQRTYVWERTIVPAGRDSLVEVRIRVRREDSDHVIGQVTFLHLVERDT